MFLSLNILPCSLPLYFCLVNFQTAELMRYLILMRGVVHVWPCICLMWPLTLSKHTKNCISWLKYNMETSEIHDWNLVISSSKRNKIKAYSAGYLKCEVARYYSLVEWSAKCQVLATHQLAGESRGGDDDAVANAMMIGWVGGSCPAHAVSLHALTAKHNKTAIMSQGISKVASSNWKYLHYSSLILIKGKNVSVTCTLCPGKKTLSTSASSNSNLMK